MKITLNKNEILNVCLNVYKKANVSYYKTDMNPLLANNATYQAEFVYPDFVSFLGFFDANIEEDRKEIMQHFINNAHYISICKNSDGDTFYVLKESFSNKVLGVFTSLNEFVINVIEQNTLSL